MANVQVLEAMHEQFLRDPQSVDPSWRYFFEGVEFGGSSQGEEQDVRTLYLIDAYRYFGHLKANLNPIAISPPLDPPELDLSRFGLQSSDLQKTFPTYGILPEKNAPLQTLLQRLQSIYCGSVGYEYMNCPYEVKRWIEERIEAEKSPFSTEEKEKIFNHLNRAELFELFLHKRYVGQKRFSLEGAETLIPLLNECVEFGGEIGIDEIVLGMAHRGRLNVLTNVLGKPYSVIVREFEDFYDPNWSGGDGDVKYHKGFSSTVTVKGGKKVRITVTANPSHLESVDPVVQGRAFGKQIAKGDKTKERTCPILIHGDSSLPGQGVVYETMQFSGLEGYGTGGTLHICVENQVGFTTIAREYRSTRYSTDIAHTFGSPVFHVNGDDPETAIGALRLALQVRQKFHRDVFVNLYCYRKYGHNEADEPSFTQPKQYEVIRKKESARELYRDQLIVQGVFDQKKVEGIEQAFDAKLHADLDEVGKKKERPHDSAFKDRWKAYRQSKKGELFDPVETAVLGKELKAITESFSKVPEGFSIHPKLLRLVEARKEKLEGKIDWALAEHLAFGSLLYEGVPVRLSGQDSQRGTFTQRHAVWVDQKTGESYFPLAHLKEGQGRFDVLNSPLSEFGVLGFEFGYSIVSPESLVIWEAQFGDFANGAQVVIDQYLTVAEQKWSRFSGLVLLLPHGYEGQGAEHSSARLERYLQLTAERNIQVVYPTTPAQYFHLLRRQVVRNVRIPLVVMTPKGLLRHPTCTSTIKEFEKGQFQEVIENGTGKESRLILCTGRIYYDLIAQKQKETAIVRIEQLYPLAKDTLKALFKKYEHASEIIWVQEEPKNMGAWSYLYPIFSDFTSKRVRYVGRKRSAATAVGSHVIHNKEQEEILKQAFEDEKRD
ncbi:MAG: Multifunctional 2-oxoglutarate metabolism enzyme [Chlamydiales bacterium]|nr:Multifunctional 2-oxoglutarate metabolism enzyme [Chlamydiales bacterium]MCH9620526.1 Multifunctional 2-oxoglutarate metabolism enzyme [Chlamydiales bacterium]MCH9623029.1 Multifunctional 2-oxoglutarate metabolism enzyme [Chlamydiales bacterium]